MKLKTLIKKETKALNDKIMLYMVTVICWDGVQYSRETDKKEIDSMRKQGYVHGIGYTNITFDFR